LKNDIIIDYNEFINFDSQQEPPHYKLFPGVCPGWDNASRRVNNYAQIFINNTPKLFGKWVQSKLLKFNPYSEEENFLFINAWNEWAEGNHLEPCQKWGHQYLEELKENLESVKKER
jgi:lipopolysaccharide biosynthesis protein